MALGDALGIDTQVLAGIINSSTGRCWSSDTYNPWPGVIETAPSSRGYTGGFGADLASGVMDAGGSAQVASGREAAAELAASWLRPADVVLVKASRGLALEHVAEHLLAHATGSSGER